ncbi:hypothetical protein D3C78_1542780 [compost metagenome]
MNPAFRSKPISANAGPVAAVNPVSTHSASGGKPIRMPIIRVISATAKAGNQPECIAAMPTISSCTKAANAA